MKPGYKTTEFWTTILTTVLLIFVANGMVDGNQQGLWAALISAVAPTIAYTMSRSSVKKNQP